MKKTADDKYRTSIYIDPVKILRLRTQYGLLLTPFVDRILDIFLEIPIDPEKKIIEEKMSTIGCIIRERDDVERICTGIWRRI